MRQHTRIEEMRDFMDPGSRLHRSISASQYARHWRPENAERGRTKLLANKVIRATG